MTDALAIPGFPVTVRHSVAWGEMDALGHVNNTRYFAWFESARIAYFRRIGLFADAPSAVGPILATTSCDFLKPVAYPDELLVGARVSKVGNTSFTMEYAAARTASPSELVARGQGVIVLVDYGTKQKLSVPDELRAAIAALS